MISELKSLIGQIDPGAGGTILGVLLGYWLSSASLTRSARRLHRKALREIRADLSSRPWNVISCRNSANDWWVTAIEDYGIIRRMRITHILDKLTSIEIPEAVGFHVDDESGGTPEQRKAYRESMDKMVQKHIKYLNSAIRWA